MNRKEELRSRIIEAAIEEFGKYGYTKAKTGDLVRKLGISKRTLYDVFPSKEKLLEETIDYILDFSDRESDRLIDSLSQNAENYVSKISEYGKKMSKTSVFLNKEFLDDLNKRFPKLIKKVEHFRNEQHRKKYAKIYDVGVKEGVTRGDIKKEMFFFITRSVVDSLLKPGAMDKLPMTLGEAFCAMDEILFSGILTDKGRAEFEKSKKENRSGIITAKINAASL